MYLREQMISGCLKPFLLKNKHSGCLKSFGFKGNDCFNSLAIIWFVSGCLKNIKLDEITKVVVLCVDFQKL